MSKRNLPPALRQSLEETKVSYMQLGSSGLRVSCPVLGAMSFGNKAFGPWVLEDEDEVMRLLKGAWDRGLNTWDTANVYSNGASEELIGKAIKKFQIPRHKIVLLTKIFGLVGEQSEVRHIHYPTEISKSKDYVNQGGLSRAAIFNTVEGCLKRLQVDYIDLLQIHRFDDTVPIEETLKALHDLVQAGKVRYIGASSMWAHQFATMQFVAETNGWTKFISMQNQYSLCYREEEREMNKFCRKTGVGLLAFAPLFRGVLARPLETSVQTTRTKAIGKGSVGELTVEDEVVINRVEELARKRSWKMTQVALAWVVQKGSIPIVGVSSLSRLDDACNIRGQSLTEEEVTYLEEPYRPKSIIGHS